MSRAKKVTPQRMPDLQAPPCLYSLSCNTWKQKSAGGAACNLMCIACSAKCVYGAVGAFAPSHTCIRCRALEG
jgi:hypothetical protein